MRAQFAELFCQSKKVFLFCSNLFSSGKFPTPATMTGGTCHRESAIERQTVIVVLNALVSYGMFHQIMQNGNVDFLQRFMDCRPALWCIHAPIPGPVLRRPCLDIGYRQDEQPSDIAELPALSI